MATTAAAPTGFPMTGVAYAGQIQHEYMSLHKLSVCGNCLALGFQKPLKRCNACRLVDYCSRECQREHWSKHKAFCNMVQGKGPKNGYLSKLKTPEDIFKVLIDSYRLRVELDHTHREENHGIYADGKLSEGLVWAAGDASDDFQKYLDLTEQSGVLPEWWRFENRMECLAEAVDKKNEDSIYNPLDQEQLMTKYEGDVAIRNALCILAELIVGYEGKGRATDGKWFNQFQEHLDLNSNERARLIAGTVEAVKNAGIVPESDG
ncbi:hypothetical protein LTR70_005215 [Exophiala xenobiotica]|uniref:MYND-type domain-containing protein n=1 Tax=Lithohypha guttulata TaxID=1690604 RepID=A0ABR0KCU9_9EURO|nr:hypothetical protein LTR24_004716 [Lithohypha guttulata]KAK5318919.1 hypothetical protein LTR70_005215 [Exophiala xenobiotica]